MATVHKLVLHAADPQHELADPQTLIGALKDIALLGAPLDNVAHGWFAGDEFLSLVTFLGCSPHVDLVPVDAAQETAGCFCHLRLQSGLEAPAFRAAVSAVQPRCGNCRAPVAQWEVLVEAWRAGRSTGRTCEKCAGPLDAPTLNWRQAAGFGRWFLEIWNIHPHEAVPAERLVATLERVTGTRCRYFYA